MGAPCGLGVLFQPGVGGGGWSRPGVIRREVVSGTGNSKGKAWRWERVAVIEGQRREWGARSWGC